MKSIPILSLLTLVVLSSVAFAEEQGAMLLNNGAWKVAPQTEVKQTGEQLSTTGFVDASWVTAHVPGTAYVDYVLAGIEKDPNFGDNVWNPVLVEKYHQNYWYRTEFIVPESYFGSGRIWLNLDSVHRDADVYVNGTKLGSMLGFCQRGRFDVTNLVKKGEKNSLAVLTHIMSGPTKKQVDGRIAYNGPAPCLHCSRGWDWMPMVPGLNTGILKDVYLTHTGEVSLRDPWIRSELPNNTEANLSVQMELANSSSTPVSGVVEGEINPGKIPFSKAVTLKPGETQTVLLTASDTPALHLVNPKLWWPNGYGEPNLYTAQLEFRTGQTISDQKKVSFGIKKYTYEVKNHVLHFFINGTQIFLKGGSWGVPEYLMRNRTAADYDTRVRLHKEQNFNVIRNWMGSVPDEAFYEACDKYGIMVWDEFWLFNNLGDPDDIPVFQANVIEKVKQVRNHPSICFWVAMNEGRPSPQVSDLVSEVIYKYDGNEREYHPASTKDDLTDSGPWTNFDPPVYFRGTFSYNGTEKTPNQEPYGMRSELGMATFTSFDSFKKFIPKDKWWPRNDMWNLHYLGEKAHGAFPENYLHKMALHYGEPSDIEDFCRKAQLLNQETMKAMFEGWLDHSDQNAAGLIIWMSHPAYPCFVWQTYDYYYDTTGSYWGAKSACEPVHIFWNSNDDRMRVSNTSGKKMENLKADLWIYNMDGTEKSHQSAKVTSAPDQVADCFKLEIPTGLSPTHFLKLRLTDSVGKVVSENFYWRGTTPLDYFGLSSMKSVPLEVTEPISEVLPGGMIRLSLDITNPQNSGTVAFSIRPKPVSPSTGEQILPVFMNDGYFSLIPGETKHLTIEYNLADAKGEKPKLVVECWNNAPHATPQKPTPPPAVINSHAQTTEISFTAAEGYTNGNLVGQKNWTGGGNTADWQVNTSGGGSATVSANAVNYSSVNYALGTTLANGYKGFVDFSFTVGATNASTLNVVGFSVADSSNSYHGPSFELKAAPGGQFSFDIYNTAALTGGWSSTANFAGSNLGVANTSGTGTSANLRFGFTTTPKGNGTNWTTVLTMTNLTTGLQVGTLTQNWTTSATGQGEASHIAMQDGSLVELGGVVRVDRVAIGSDRDSLK